MVCPQCSQENPESNRYCGGCGSPLRGEEPAAPRYADRGSIVWREAAILIAGIALILLAAAGAYYLTYYRGSPVSVVRAFVEADRTGRDAEQARYVSTRWDSKLILSALQAYRRTTGASPFQSYKIEADTVTGTEADVYLTIYQPLPNNGMPNAPNGRQGYSVVFSLVREENEWKIDPSKTLASLGGAFLGRGLGNLLPNGGNVIPLPGFTPPPATPNRGQPGAGSFGSPAPSRYGIHPL